MNNDKLAKYYIAIEMDDEKLEFSERIKTVKAKKIDLKELGKILQAKNNSNRPRYFRRKRLRYGVNNLFTTRMASGRN